jgi:hypothetical protein
VTNKPTPLFYDRLTTPRGPGYYLGLDAEDPARALVQHRRQDFTPDQWKELTPYNGPCTTRWYALAEVEVDLVYKPRHRASRTFKKGD